jgi:hypothetical protein
MSTFFIHLSTHKLKNCMGKLNGLVVVLISMRLWISKVFLKKKVIFLINDNISFLEVYLMGKILFQ